MAMDFASNIIGSPLQEEATNSSCAPRRVEAKVMAANASANSTPHRNGKLPIMERKKDQFPRGERVVDG
jgi:hypothetical protein